MFKKVCGGCSGAAASGHATFLRPLLGARAALLITLACPLSALGQEPGDRVGEPPPPPPPGEHGEPQPPPPPPPGEHGEPPPPPPGEHGEAPAAEQHGEAPAHHELAAGAHGEATHGEAGAGHGGGHGVTHLDNWFSFDYGKPDSKYKNGPLGFAILNFTILIILLVRFTKKPLVSYLATRHETIKQDLAEAANLRDQAQRKLAEISARLDNLGKEVAQIKADVAQDAELEKQRIIEAAHKEAERIIAVADRTLERELRRARRRLESETVERALKLAEELVEQNIKLADRKKINERYIAQIGAPGGEN